MTKNASQNSIVPIHGPQVYCTHLPPVLRGSGGRSRGSAWPWPLNRGFLVCSTRGCPHLGGSPGGGCHPELQGREHSWLEGRWEQAASCGNRNCQVLPSLPRGPRDSWTRSCSPAPPSCLSFRQMPHVQTALLTRHHDDDCFPGPQVTTCPSPSARRRGPAAPRLCHPLGCPSSLSHPGAGFQSLWAKAGATYLSNL